MLAITMPVKNRADVLPHTLEALVNLQYPAEDTAVIIYDDASTDGTRDVLTAFRRRHKDRFGGGIKIIRGAVDDSLGKHINRHDRHFAGKSEHYAHLCDVRNALIDAAITAGADYQLSIDSDIIVSPGLAWGLMAHDLPYVATIVLNDCHMTRHIGYNRATWLRRHINAGMVSPDGRYHAFTRYALDSLYSVGITGACYLVTRAVLDSGVRFGPNRHGEDIGYCLGLEAAGISRHLDTTPRALHAMTPELIPEALGLLQLWFPPSRQIVTDDATLADTLCAQEGSPE
jgi:glycosyltransferase involved in cell wall biosynthesis